MKEKWKDIPGHEGKYQASTEGRIRSVDRQVMGRCHYTGESFIRNVKGKVLSPGRSKTGHLSVVLGRGENGSQVHQLIMRTFVGEPPQGMEVLHKNGDPADNRLCNLHYGTRTENILDVYNDGGRWRKLSADDVEAIRFGLATGLTGRELAAMFKVSESTISCIKRKVTYSWLK